MSSYPQQGYPPPQQGYYAPPPQQGGYYPPPQQGGGYYQPAYVIRAMIILIHFRC